MTTIYMYFHDHRIYWSLLFSRSINILPINSKKNDIWALLLSCLWTLWLTSVELWWTNVKVMWKRQAHSGRGSNRVAWCGHTVGLNGVLWVYGFMGARWNWRSINNINLSQTWRGSAARQEILWTVLLKIQDNLSNSKVQKRTTK